MRGKSSLISGVLALAVLVLTSGMLTLGWYGQALAGSFKDATLAYQGGDYAAAATLIRPLAEQGDMQAQRYLGIMYANGQGVARNDKEAVKWYGRAAEQGDADAQVNLGVMYSAARGTSRNLVQAHKWFNVAASLYPLSDRDKRQQAMKNGERLAAKMSPDQIAEATKLAREWVPKA